MRLPYVEVLLRVKKLFPYSYCNPYQDGHATLGRNLRKRYDSTKFGEEGMNMITEFDYIC